MFILNFLAESAEVQPGVAALLTIVFVLVAGALIFFLYRGVQRERNRYIAEKLKVGIMNKSSFDALIERRFKIARRRTHFTVMYIKILNGAALLKSLGDKQYEAFLDALQSRLYEILPKGSKVCVYNEDRLAACIDEDLDKKSLSDMSGFCLMECRKPVTLVTKVRVTAELSIAAAVFDYAQKLTAERFKENIEQALVSSERSGANRFVIYTPELDYEDDENSMYYRGIQSALEGNDFVLYYRPIIDFETNAVFGYDTDVVWNHPELGAIRSEKFVPALVQSGEIHRVGQHVFTQLCAAVLKYKQIHTEDGAPVRFAFSASTRQMMSSSFPDDLYRIIKKLHGDPSEIYVGLTEFGAQAVRENVKKFNSLGFNVALDGVEMADNAAFLGELQNVRFAWIKLPASFIMQSQQNFFISGMIDMLKRYSQEHGVVLIASGIENEAEADFVKQQGFRYVSGSFYSEDSPLLD
ncbi:MAG: GGDEF domain-containing protein [Clostridia bacterium]|nr:GGDEF domain-containing protein [Clostridia bacterium]